MTWLITGATGQLGMAFRRAIAKDINACFADRNICNLADAASIAECLERHQPKVIINCAAYTAVDAAEDDEATAVRVNATAVGEMACWAADHKAIMVHFSTDYVFDGTASNAYSENAPVNPISAYGRSKAKGECLFLESATKGFCLRTSWVHSVEGRNFFSTMKRLMTERDHLRIVDDQNGVPTTTDFLVKTTFELIALYQKKHNDMPRLLHAVPRGKTSWYGFACRIRDMIARFNDGEKLAKLEPIPSSEFPQAASRPKNSVMTNTLMETLLGNKCGTWEDWHDKLYKR